MRVSPVGMRVGVKNPTRPATPGLIARRRLRITRSGRAGQENAGERFGADSILVDKGDAYCAIRTRLSASRRFPYRQAAGAHVAFANNPALVRVLRRIVWTFQNAILATDALV